MKTIYDIYINGMDKEGWPTACGGFYWRAGRNAIMNEISTESVCLIRVGNSHLQISFQYKILNEYITKVFVVSLTPKGKPKELTKFYTRSSGSRECLGRRYTNPDEIVSLRINGKNVKASANYNEDD